MSTLDWIPSDVRAEMAAALTDTAQCSMYMRSFFGEIFRCEGASTHKVSQGCVHEHCGDYMVCESCAVRAVGPDARPLYCNPCTESADPHECVVTATVSPLAAKP